MKQLAFLFLAIAALVSASCEKVIDVDLNNAAPIIVIEGTVTNRADSQIVKINRSVPFGEPNLFPPVSGAIVTLRDNVSGRVVIVRERRPGYYMVRNFTGRSGVSYSLNVEVEGKTYTAISTMPNQVNIDSLGLSVSSIFGEDQRTVQLLYKDPPNEKNYYRFSLKVNGVISKKVFPYDDNFNNGRPVTRDLFDLDLNTSPGDQVEIEMQCIDPQVYRYWQGIDQNQSRGGASTTPANPISNIKGGALGYFSAHTRQNETWFIPES